MDDSTRKGNSGSIVRDLTNLQLGGDADRRSFGYRATYNSLMNLTPTKGLPNDANIGIRQMAELQFNSKGNLLATSYWVEDKIPIWDWDKGILKTTICAGHNFSVEHFNWIPYSNDNLFVTGGHYGDIRLTDLTTNHSRVLLDTSGQNQGALGLHHAYSFSVCEDLPHTILAGGHIGDIVQVDVREAKPTPLFDIKDKYGRPYKIYSLDINPVKCTEFCVGGTNSLRIYDHRYSSQPVVDLHLTEPYDDPDGRPYTPEDRYVGHVKYNYNGSEVLASPNADPVYLFDTSKPTEPKTYSIVKCSRYQSYNIYDAHLCGRKSEFLVMISAVGEGFQRYQRVYIWDKESQTVLRAIPLIDDSWRFTVHPSLPILAMNWDHQGIRLWE